MTESQWIVAQIVEHVEPIERGERYEDPLDVVFRKHGIGEVTGGGSQLSATGEIDFVDIEIALTNLDEAVNTVVETLEGLGAPAGSSIQFGEDTDRTPRPFGKRQQLTLYLDGTRLPDTVYEGLDFDALYDQFSEIAAQCPGGAARSVWTGPQETAVHFVANEVGALADQIESLWDALPILQNARLVTRYGDERPPLETRLPLR